jgi:Ca2+/H+ antiporter, TMEM165/GDT1 family
VSTSTILVLVGAFLASAVEMVEALTIVLGVGVIRGWRSTLIGAGAAGARAGGARRGARARPELDPDRHASPRRGALLLAFGLRWLRKAILRSSGYKELHDEDAAFRSERMEAAAAGDEQRAGLNWYSFTVAFKGVLLEGLAFFALVSLVLVRALRRRRVVPVTAGAEA